MIITSDDDIILDLHETTGNSSSSACENPVHKESLSEETVDNPVDSAKIA